MAEHVVVNKTDDIDGTPAEETILFSIDGRSYIIDLNTEHARTFRSVVKDWADYARPAQRGPRPRTPQSRDRAASIRTWAQHKGYDVKDLGRISNDIVKEYDNRLGA